MASKMEETSSDVEETLANALMKGLLFVQEMYHPDWSLIETFYKAHP